MASVPNARKMTLKHIRQKVHHIFMKDPMSQICCRLYIGMFTLIHDCHTSSVLTLTFS